MKCCGTPTPFTAVSPPDAAHSATKMMQALLFTEILKPLSAGLGPVGGVAIDSTVQSIFMKVRP